MTISSSERAGEAGRTGACQCIAKVDAELAARGDNTMILVPLIGPQRPFVETTKADSQKRGKPSKLFANFCPFCGSKYPAGRAALSAKDGR